MDDYLLTPNIMKHIIFIYAPAFLIGDIVSLLSVRKLCTYKRLYVTYVCMKNDFRAIYILNALVYWIHTQVNNHEIQVKFD